MLVNLLASDAGDWGKWLMMGILVAIIVVFMVFNRKSQQKREKEMMDKLNAIQPGNKVKTIGGICGVVVEVCPEDNTFVLETGTEARGKSYIKFDKQAVYQTDAVAKAEEAEVADAPAEEPFEEHAVPAEAPEAPETEAAETTEEEKTEE